MKKLIFTLLCVAMTMQFSFAQYHIFYIPTSLPPTTSFPGNDSTLVNTSIDTSTTDFNYLNPVCMKTDSLTGYIYTGNFNSTTGYANGTNSHGDLEKMEKYLIPAKSVISYAIALIYTSTLNSNDSVAAVIHDNTGKPLDTSSYVHLDSLSKLAYANNLLTFNYNYQVFTFNVTENVYNADSFYVGITMPKGAFDTVAVASGPNGCYAAGNLAWEKRSDGSYHPFSQAWNLKTDFIIFPVYQFNGSLSTTTGPTLNGLTLNAAYPNPTNSSVNVNYALAQSANVRVEMYNVVGQQVIAQSLGNQNPGKYTQNVDMSHLAKGTYFYSIVTDNARLFGQIEVQ